MTPKQKADELIAKMDIIHRFKIRANFIPISMHDDQIAGCAIVCVEEIVKLDVCWFDKMREFEGKLCEPEQKLEFWEDVLTELKKL